jgi:hypothetical protein
MKCKMKPKSVDEVLGDWSGAEQMDIPRIKQDLYELLSKEPKVRTVESWLKENREFVFNLPKRDLEIFIKGMNKGIVDSKQALTKALGVDK